MTIKKKTRSTKLEIDLNGPEGNAYVLLGHARKLSITLNKDANAICNEMTSGDYEI